MSRLRCVSRAPNDRTRKERKTEEKIPETRPTIANGIEYIRAHGPRRSNLRSINKPARPSRVIALALSILSTPRDCRGQTISREEAFRNFAAGTIYLRARARPNTVVGDPTVNEQSRRCARRVTARSHALRFSARCGSRGGAAARVGCR